MRKQLKKLVSDCLTGKDGVTYDPARVALALGVLVFLGNSIAALAKGQPWGPQEFGTGFGLLIAGGGLGVKLKSNTEPGQQ